VLVTTDKDLAYQQNLSGSKLGVVVLGGARWRPVEARVTQVVTAVSSAKPGTCTFVDVSAS